MGPATNSIQQTDATQDARIGMLLQTEMARRTTGSRPLSELSPDEKFPIFLEELESRVNEVETHLAGIRNPQVLNPYQMGALKRVERILARDRTTDISRPLLEDKEFETFSVRRLTSHYWKQDEIESCHKLLKEVDGFIRNVIGWLGQINPIKNRSDKLAQVKALEPRLGPCYSKIHDFLTGVYNVESWALKIILNTVERITGDKWNDDDNKDGKETVDEAVDVNSNKDAYEDANVDANEDNQDVDDASDTSAISNISDGPEEWE